jgi:transcriptional accessory protein Tex/SPT6
MELWQHLKASGETEIQGLTEGLAARFAELIGRGHSVADLLAHYGDEFGHLPAERLRALAQAHRTWQLWRRRKTQLEQVRRNAGLPDLPEAAFTTAPRPDQLDAIVRTARLEPAADVQSPEVIALCTTGIELWTRCMALTRKQGRVISRAKDLEHPHVAEFDAYVKLDEKLEELAPHRWLAMRRGERAGVLELKLELPEAELLEEVTRFQSRLGQNAASRAPESLLRELILDDLTPWLLRLLDMDAQTQAVRGATEAFAGLLRSAPVQARQLGAVHVIKSGAPVAMVSVDREGELAAQRVVKGDGSWLDKVMEFVGEHGLQTMVIPTSAPGTDMLAALETKLGSASVQVVKVRSAALSEARQPLVDPPHRLSASVASAIVLARRALDPLKEWCLVDPVAIGIAEYQNDLDADQLRAALAETAELCRLERRRGKRVHMGGSVPRGSTAMARLNPLVKSLADLRGGMTVHGVITNISHFGAFVNIGLPQEALVHISELSDRFVSNPNEVVSIGQQVTAHVLSVDPSRGRISLSLKTQRPGMDREERRAPGNGFSRSYPSPGPRPGPSLGAGGQMSKAQALANLEKLFKK